MTAQEMFEKLGFRKNTSIYYGKDHIVYEKVIGGEDDDCGLTIYLQLNSKKAFSLITIHGIVLLKRM